MNTELPKWARIAVAAATALAAVALAACGSDEGEAVAAPSYEEALSAAPPKLAEHYANGSELIEGGEEAYDRSIAEVRGHPVVVNHWASWCGPCREEFPFFQSQAAEHADEIAFMGVDTEDTPEAYATFLRDNPIPYPSVEDPDGDLPEWTGVPLLGQPNTLFYDANGKLVHTRQGPYSSEEELAADIERYALDA